MKQKDNILLDLIQVIESWLEAENPCEELCRAVEDAKMRLGGHLGITPIQALFVSVIFINTSCENDGLFNDRNLGLGDLSRILKKSKAELFKYMDDFDRLIETGILATDDEINKTRQNFSIPSYVTDSIINNTPFENPGARETRIGLPEILRRQHEHIQKTNETGRTPIFRLVKHLDEKYSKLEDYYPLIKYMNGLNLDPEEKILFFEVCGSVSFNTGRVHVITLADIIYVDHDRKRSLYESFISGEHTLIREEMIEVEGTYVDDLEATLTDKALKMYLGDGAAAYQKRKKNDKNMLLPEAIPERELFFEGECAEQLALLEQSINQDEYLKLKEALTTRGLSSGVTAILFGPPGTGKTESVMQMARRTGRGLIRVDISASKSKWFGESEKIIKRIFTSYKTLAKREKLCPILLFNEADAIFGHRKSGELQSTDQALNTMQNILLEELEGFEGIMIATTNLIDNLDTAFERRFLFKIKLPLPSAEIKSRIWHSRLPMIPEQAFRRIANRWDFSGGEIDNVVRKAAINEILRGEQPSADMIELLCTQEKLPDSARPQIGFR